MAGLVPRIVAGIDLRTFKLDAMDGFVFSRIDGRLASKDLARETGLPDFTVDRVLDKLVKVGAVEMIDPTAPPPPKAPPAEMKRPELPTFDVSISGPKYDPKELEEEVDLTLDQKKRMLDLFYRLDDLDHYTLLGLSDDADKKAIKRQYFELAAVMHPDRYFKKNIGSFKPKMEALFARITEAHDTLVDVAKRTEYDAYIKEVATTRGMEAMLERAMEESRRAAQAAVAATPASTPPREPSAPPVQVPAGPSADDLKARREALARRLMGGSGSVRPPASRQPSAPPKEPPNPLRYSNSADAVDALRRRYEERIDSATVAQARKYADAAEESFRRNDLVAAASSYGIAIKFAPMDAAMAMRFQEIKNEADKLLVDSYTKQAVYEERSGHWTEASKNWEKVVKLKPQDARARERAAHALLKCEGDLHQAAEHAKAALGVDPSIIGYHVTLAEVYAAAGLNASAKRAAETGLALEPKNATLLAIQKKVGK